MKKLICLFVVLTATFTNAQEQSNWKKSGTVTLLFNQSAFNNEWLGGGVSNVAGNLAVNYQFNYAKNDWSWDNRVMGAYGLTKIKGEDMTKSEDRLEFNSILGKKTTTKNWFYSAILNFKTQMDRGEDKNGNYISHFMSPAYLQNGLGMLYKKGDNFSLNLAPVASKFIFVNDQFTATQSSFGVAQGESSRFEIGASVNVYSKYEVIKNVTFENILNLYSNYKEDPQNVDIDYVLNIAMKINKNMSTNISFQTIYDDNAIKAAQVKEVFGLGINYGF